jgi:L-seryl-tRNA(Ser) seleniumtransferase
MAVKQSLNRRKFMGATGVLAAGALSAPELSGSPMGGRHAEALSGFGASGDVYKELGVTTVINGQGTMTVLGGSLIRAEVEAVMAQAARHFVSIPDLEVAAGNKIAQMLKLPDGYTVMVTSGAAGALQSGLAGILTKDNPDFIRQLPDLAGMKSEVIIQKSHRYPFDHQLRATGVKLVEVETRDDVQKAICDRTAMMHFSNFANAEGQIKVDEWLKIAKQHNIPAFNDAAADTPPVSHLWDYANMGYDLVAFSGGKAIRGPQCAGLLLGRKDLVSYALLNNSPYEDTLGRGQKIGKEEIAGMVKALELYLNEDHDALAKEWSRRLNVVSDAIKRVPGVTTSFFEPDIANHVPTMKIAWDPKRVDITPRDASKALIDSKPSIVLGGSHDGLEMTAFMLKPGEDKIIAERLTAILKDHVAS